MTIINVDDQVTWLTAVADANTPPELLTYVGKIVGIPKSVGAGLANGDPGIIFGVPGRARNNSGAWEWVMGTVDLVTLAVVGLMPGGWTKPAARDQVVAIAREMLRRGISATDTSAVCSTIINAVLLEKS